MTSIKLIFSLCVLMIMGSGSVAQTPGKTIKDSVFFKVPYEEKGRPYSAISGDDLRSAIPTLEDRWLDLPCVLVTDDSGYSDNGTRSPYLSKMSLFLFERNISWVFWRFTRLSNKPCEAGPLGAAGTVDSAKSP